MSRRNVIWIAACAAIVLTGFTTQTAQAQYRDWRDAYGARAPTRYYTQRPIYDDRGYYDRGYYQSDYDFVVGLYHDLLKREPKRSEVEFWVRSLELGVPREKVIHDFKRNMEYLGLRTDDRPYRSNYRDDYRAPRGGDSFVEF